jgi:hypothetical protein
MKGPVESSSNAGGSTTSTMDDSSIQHPASSNAGNVDDAGNVDVDDAIYVHV